MEEALEVGGADCGGWTGGGDRAAPADRYEHHRRHPVASDAEAVEGVFERRGGVGGHDGAGGAKQSVQQRGGDAAGPGSVQEAEEDRGGVVQFRECGRGEGEWAERAGERGGGREQLLAEGGECGGEELRGVEGVACGRWLVHPFQRVEDGGGSGVGERSCGSQVFREWERVEVDESEGVEECGDWRGVLLEEEWRLLCDGLSSGERAEGREGLVCELPCVGDQERGRVGECRCGEGLL